MGAFLMAMKGEFYMAVNEQIVTGRAKRVLIDKAAKLWQRISEWTKASDIEFNDGQTAETKVGAIDGITDSLASTSSRIAASAKSVSQLNNDLMFPDGTKFYPDKQNGKYGFNTDPNRGADTFSPFNTPIKIVYVSGTFKAGSGFQIPLTHTIENRTYKYIGVKSANCDNNEGLGTSRVAFRLSNTGYVTFPSGTSTFTFSAGALYQIE